MKIGQAAAASLRFFALFAEIYLDMDGVGC